MTARRLLLLATCAAITVPITVVGTLSSPVAAAPDHRSSPVVAASAHANTREQSDGRATSWGQQAHGAGARVSGRGCASAVEFRRTKLRMSRLRVNRLLSARHYTWPEHVYPGSRRQTVSYKPCAGSGTYDYRITYRKRGGVWRAVDRDWLWNW